MLLLLLLSTKLNNDDDDDDQILKNLRIHILNSIPHIFGYGKK